MSFHTGEFLVTSSPAPNRPAASATLSLDPTPFLERGSRAYWHAAIALLFAGYATFSLLYCVQPLLPEFTKAFGVSPAQSALSVSVTTASLAIAIFAAGFVSEGWSRHKLMTLSLTASSLLTIIVAFLPSWPALLFVRALEGLALGGVPAVAMAYLAEEVHPAGLGLAMGLYVGGTAIGGMAGRVISGILADVFSWRVAIGGIGVLGLLATVAFRWLLPPSRRFVPRSGMGFGHHRTALTGHLRNRGLPFLFLMGFVLMGAFVTIYNYVGYRLIGAPFHLNQTEIGGHFHRVSDGGGGLAVGGEDGRCFRPRPRTDRRALINDHRRGNDVVEFVAMGYRRDCLHDVWLFLRACSCERVGRLARARRERAGGCAVFARVLHRFKRAGFVGRPFLGIRWLARRHRPCFRCAPARADRRRHASQARDSPSRLDTPANVMKAFCQLVQASGNSVPA